ncbi:MAG: sigma-70 family RNA polymerase sigma factor [Bacteroidales bacterium]|nr:sigma-70 family RNA polymerase sigma factor [Bacteroidales bacterium]
MSEKEYNNCVNLFSDRLYCFVVRNVQEKFLSEDIVAESYLILWKKKDEVDFIKAKTFLFNTANYLILQNLKNKKISQTYKENVLLKENYENNEFENQNFINFITQSLPEKYSQCIVMKDFEGYSYEEIATRLKISLPSVKNIIYRARILIQDIINKEIR